MCVESGVLKWDLSANVLMGEREGEGLAGLRPGYLYTKFGKFLNGFCTSIQRAKKE